MSNSWRDKKDIVLRIEYFLKPKSSGANITKEDLKNTTGVDTLDFDKKIDLARLKSDVDKLFIV